MGIKIIGAQHYFGRNVVLLTVQPVLRTEIGNAAFRRNARAAEKDNVITL